MKITKLIKILVIAICSLQLQSCIVAAVGAGVGAVKWANSKKHQAYNEYIISMQTINMDREKNRLKPQPIMSYKEYLETNK